MRLLAIRDPLASIGLVALLATACTVSRGGRPTASTASVPGAAGHWATPLCAISDSTAASPDTVYVVGGALALAGEPLPRCAGERHDARTAPVAVTLGMPPDADLRDVLEIGVGADRRRPDVLVTIDPVVSAFARERGGYLVAPLPWNRSYALVTAQGRAIAVFPAQSERDQLAREALRAPARGAVEPLPGRGGDGCTSEPPAARREPSRAIAFPANDPIGRQLAERLVALTGMERTLAVPAESLHAAITDGRAVAVVQAIARDPRAPCLVRDGSRVPTTAVPLVDIHGYAIVRRGSGVRLLVGPDGRLHFVGQRGR